MPKPKFVKPLLIGVACTIPVGLVVGLSINWDHTQYISAVGSSGVKPFIENFGKKYHKQNSKFDVTVESGGTTFAVEELAKGYTNLGNASNNPYPNIHDQGFTDRWQDKKTLTLAWEGLCLLYSLPKDLSQETKENFEIVINEDNILKLYGVFSCIHELKGEDWKSEYETLWYYAPQEVQNKITNSHDQDLLKSTKILPFLRAGGNTGANSSIAFTYYSNLRDFDEMTDAQQKAFAGGQYGNDSPYMETDESNARAWQSFVTKDQDGSMVYLTTSFLTNDDNISQIKEHGYKLAKYQYPDQQPIGFDLDDIKTSLDSLGKNTNGYNWYRPINVMIDLDVQKSKDFLYWIYFGNNTQEQPQTFAIDYYSTVYSLGAKPINMQQFSSMLAGEGSYKDRLFAKQASDIELEKTRQEEIFKQVYGAEDIWE